MSVIQYIQIGRVTWVTNTFSWVEHHAADIVEDPKGSIDKAGTAIRDIASNAGPAIPQKDLSDIPDTINPTAEISWSAPSFALSGLVIKVADGDTLTIRDAQGTKHKIRLYGIDTPEYDQPHYEEAKNALFRLVSHEGVGIDIKDTDSYGRTVGTVYVGGTNVNLEMVRRGHAWWYKRYARLNSDLREAQEHAKGFQLGLWAESNPTPPWEWRRKSR